MPPTKCDPQQYCIYTLYNTSRSGVGTSHALGIFTPNVSLKQSEDCDEVDCSCSIPTNIWSGIGKESQLYSWVFGYSMCCHNCPCNNHQIPPRTLPFAIEICHIHQSPVTLPSQPPGLPALRRIACSVTSFVHYALPWNPPIQLSSWACRPS